jgi:hypothetical protein
MQAKIEMGQFYTLTNPFDIPRFREWIQGIPLYETKRYLEPFGGANNIISMISESYPEIPLGSWRSFDLQPESQDENRVPEVELEKRDTIKSFPNGFDICITNPPYLAKNSATRKGSALNFEGYQDLFEMSLGRMLSNCSWIAAIIPESFLTRGLFTDRLEFVISLNMEMFGDTEFPVCLAVFSEQSTSDFEIWAGENFLGKMSQLRTFEESRLLTPPKGAFKFNDPSGTLGLTAIDSTTQPSIRFHHGEVIPSSDIKNSSRAMTRISSRHLPANKEQLSQLIEAANRHIEEYRDGTKDVFLTSFKGLRKDGHYRRRMDWNTASKVLATAMVELAPELASDLSAYPRLI